MNQRKFNDPPLRIQSNDIAINPSQSPTVPLSIPIKVNVQLTHITL
jgi:hypothetical protein